MSRTHQQTWIVSRRFQRGYTIVKALLYGTQTSATWLTVISDFFG